MSYMKMKFPLAALPSFKLVIKQLHNYLKHKKNDLMVLSFG